MSFEGITANGRVINRTSSSKFHSDPQMNIRETYGTTPMVP
eukprot:UN20447